MKKVLEGGMLNLSGIVTVLWEKWHEFKRDCIKITLSIIIAPVMYLIVFGLGVHTSVDGRPYIQYLIPGMAAMASMTGSFGAVAQNMSVQRLYERALDQVMISPTPLWQFLFGQIAGGGLRGLYAGSVIVLITLPLQKGIGFTPLSFLIMLLNGMVFSTIALVLSFFAKTYSDAPRYNSYIILPMSFLCNTFFSTDALPAGVRQVIAILPLSQTSRMIRAIAFGTQITRSGIIILLAYLVIFSAVSVVYVYKKENR